MWYVNYDHFGRKNELEFWINVYGWWILLLELDVCMMVDVDASECASALLSMLSKLNSSMKWINKMIKYTYLNGKNKGHIHIYIYIVDSE